MARPLAERGYRVAAHQAVPGRRMTRLVTGYIPTAAQIAEGDENLGDWYWVSETAETVLADGLRLGLAPETPEANAQPDGTSPA